MSVPISLTSTSAVLSSMPSMVVRSTPVTRNRGWRASKRGSLAPRLRCRRRWASTFPALRSVKVSSRDTRNIGHGSTDRRTEPLVRVIARKKVVVFGGMRAVTRREVFCPGENCPTCKSFTRQAFLAPWPILPLSRQDPLYAQHPADVALNEPFSQASPARGGKFVPPPPRGGGGGEAGAPLHPFGPFPPPPPPQLPRPPQQLRARPPAARCPAGALAHDPPRILEAGE